MYYCPQYLDAGSREQEAGQRVHASLLKAQYEVRGTDKVMGSVIARLETSYFVGYVPGDCPRLLGVCVQLGGLDNWATRFVKLDDVIHFLGLGSTSHLSLLASPPATTEAPPRSDVQLLYPKHVADFRWTFVRSAGCAVCFY